MSCLFEEYMGHIYAGLYLRQDNDGWFNPMCNIAGLAVG